MPRAFNLLRAEPAYRREAFDTGLSALGYSISSAAPSAFRADDVLLIWNRHAHDELARKAEAVGARVLVAENGYLGREWNGGIWYAISEGHHNGAGRWPGSNGEPMPPRWATFGVELEPWIDRPDGYVLLLPTRRIGEPSIREPADWLEKNKQFCMAHGIKHKIRLHPGNDPDDDGLMADLEGADRVWTWSSGAAIKALANGVWVLAHMPNWIASCNRNNRLEVFERMSWAMWELAEIKSGQPFRLLLK